MNSRYDMKTASYVFCSALLFLSVLTIVSLIAARPPVIYTYKSILFTLALSCLIVGLSLLEMRIRTIGVFTLKRVLMSLFPCSLLILFSLPSMAWFEYYVSDFNQTTVVSVEGKKVKYYRNSVICFELSLKNGFIDGDLCSSSQMYADSPIYGRIEIKYKVSSFGYLVKD